VSWTGIIIFAVTYLLISARRLSWLGLDRPAGALLGAVCCVAAGVLTPAEAVGAVNGLTILGGQHHRRGGRAGDRRDRVLRVPPRRPAAGVDHHDAGGALADPAGG